MSRTGDCNENPQKWGDRVSRRDCDPCGSRSTRFEVAAPLRQIERQAVIAEQANELSVHRLEYCGLAVFLSRIRPSCFDPATRIVPACFEFLLRLLPTLRIDMTFGSFRVSTRACASALAIAILAAGVLAVRAEPATSQALEAAYQPDVVPLLKHYCHECHGPDGAEADLNLAAFAAWGDIRKHPQTWQKVGEMLTSGQMPPKDAEQPNDAERARLNQWVLDYLTFEATARAGDPGKVVLRRLSNAEYTYTLRDLTGVDSLDPAREFPVDGAAGEGFTNTGNALVMSPALVTKYLDAAKEVAGHTVLLPDGFRFSPHTTPRDWTDDTLARIRAFYGQFTDAGGSDKVNLQGIVFNTNEGGRLPLEKYLAATLADRDALVSGSKTIQAVASERGLNAKYLGILWSVLTDTKPSVVLDGLRARWRAAQPDDAGPLLEYVVAWQKGLWKFTTVGHVGKVGGPKRWLEPVSPLVSKQDIRFKIPPVAAGKDVTISLVATDAGDGNDHDVVVWQQPRLVAPGRPDLLLRDVRRVASELAARRERMFASAAKYLAAADEVAGAGASSDIAKIAAKHDIDGQELAAWLDYLGIGSGGGVELAGHFTSKIANSSGYDFIKGWGTDATPLLIANSSDQHVRVPGNMKPHGVAVHPSPSLRAAVGWQSPVAATVRIEGAVTHAHPECGNGVTWSLELRRGATRQRLATGTAQGAAEVKVGPIENLSIQAGDLVSLLIGPRDGNHSCDLTAIDLKITDANKDSRIWNLAQDVSPDVLAGNPHGDRFGNKSVWHFYTEPDKATAVGPVIPTDSLLAKWQTAKEPGVRQQLAEQVQKLLTSAAPAGDGPDSQLYRQMASLSGPLLGNLRSQTSLQKAAGNSNVGLEPALFGQRPDGIPLDSASLCVRAPSTVTIDLPAELVAGCELMTTGMLDSETGGEGSVQLQVVAGNPTIPAGLLPNEVVVLAPGGQHTADNRVTTSSMPILVNENSAARKRIESGLDEFRQLFPAALCYTKIVPVDEVVTLTLFYREDDHLQRLMLDDAQRAELDRLWDELHFVSRDALTLVDALAQLIEFATQDADPKVFEPMRGPINERAAAFRQQLVDSEPKQLDALLAFANRAYRRPLTEAESNELRGLYVRLRQQELPHEDAFRLTLARMLIAPGFLYRIEKPGPGVEQAPVSDLELANRLSYFLWSSQPDDELLELAAAGRLHDSDAMVAQTHRMLRNDKTRRLATEFACQWLHIYDFDQLDEKSDRHFPTFVGIRGAMYEESIRFFTDLFQNNGSVLDIIDADYTFLNEDLAKHYGIEGVTGPEWRRVDGVRKLSYGGILGQATTLAKQSGASRTSPILRGNWISEVVLGERLPRPPKGVPQLPDDEAATAGLTVRQLVEKHTSDQKCSVCHRRIDPLGFSLEGFDAIGRRRDKDLGDRPIDTRVETIDGAQFEGPAGLRNYLLTVRRDAFVRQFCKKLLGYALGRSVQLSDEPLLTEMQAELKSNDDKIVTAIDLIVKSRQFREIRGRETAYDD